MKVSRIIMIVVGALLALIGFALLAGSIAGLVTYATQRTDGYFQTGEVRLASADLLRSRRTTSTWRANRVTLTGSSSGALSGRFD